MLIDEATANVDEKTDEQIQLNLRRDFSKCSVLTVAHRLKTIIDSDKILVMKNGTVAEFDSPKNLLEVIFDLTTLKIKNCQTLVRKFGV